MYTQDEKEDCQRCDKITTWTPVARGKRLKCLGGCEAEYPCKSKNCGHLDCSDERVKNDNT